MILACRRSGEAGAVGTSAAIRLLLKAEVVLVDTERSSKNKIGLRKGSALTAEIESLW